MANTVTTAGWELHENVWGQWTQFAPGECWWLVATGTRGAYWWWVEGEWWNRAKWLAAWKRHNRYFDLKYDKDDKHDEDDNHDTGDKHNKGYTHDKHDGKGFAFR